MLVSAKEMLNKRDTKNVAGVYQRSGLSDIFLDGIVRAVKHDGREARVNASLCALKRAVVKVQRNGNSCGYDKESYLSRRC